MLLKGILQSTKAQKHMNARFGGISLVSSYVIVVQFRKAYAPIRISVFGNKLFVKQSFVQPSKALSPM